jgi:FkbM family methyltransferase
MNLRLYETRRGLMFHLENDNCIGLALAKYGEWAEHELSLMKKFIHPGDVVLDVGANIGTHSLAFQKWVGAAGLVLAFEPQKKIFQILCANLAVNNCPSIFAINALISKENKIHFFSEEIIDEKTNFGSVSFSNTNSKSINQSTKQTKFPLTAIQLDTLDLARCDFMKIDVEGMELEVLKSSKELIKTYHPIIFFEQVSSRNFVEVVSFLKNHNYRLYWQVTYPLDISKI